MTSHTFAHTRPSRSHTYVRTRRRSVGRSPARARVVTFENESIALIMSAFTTSFTGVRVVSKTAVAKKSVSTKAVASMENVKKAAVVAATTLAMSSPAFAATIKLGGDNGELGFFPSSLTVKAGETVEFVNNKAFPHNVVFDEDAVPDGVNADAISHEDYLNGPGEKVSNKFDKAGTYEFYCEPHQGAGMQGKIIVQ